MSGWHHRYENGVRNQDRIAEHFSILFSWVSRRAINEYYIVRIDRQCGFQKVPHVSRLQAQNFVGTACTFSSPSPRESARLATIRINDQRTIASSHERTR